MTISTHNRTNFEIAFDDVSDSVGDIWLCLVSYLKANRLLPSKFKISQIAGHPEPLIRRGLLSLTSEEISRLIQDRSLNGFTVYTKVPPRSLDYWLNSPREPGNHATFRPHIDSLAKTPEKWTGLIDSLMNLVPSIGAWEWNILYESWQANSRLYDQYESTYGQIPPGARRWTEKSIDTIGKDAEFVDVSLNPGRTRKLDGIVYFHATAEMWLGPDFWQYAKCTKEEVLESDIFLEKRENPHFLYLKCWPTAFTRPDGEQGRMQQRLWKLFFHEDCEWPPGSGTICEKPMYGPPEFMPT